MRINDCFIVPLLYAKLKLILSLSALTLYFCDSLWMMHSCKCKLLEYTSKIESLSEFPQSIPQKCWSHEPFFQRVEYKNL